MASTTEPQQPLSKPRAPKVSALPKHAHSKLGTLVTRSLPTYTGPHSVGVLDVEYPIERQVIGSFKHKKVHTKGQVGFELETVLFSLHYPCEVVTGKRAGTQWFPRFGPTIAGFLDMANMNKWYYRSMGYVAAFPAVHGLSFPAYQRAPLECPPDGGRWPVIIFSHGVGCSRLMYTQICGELASRGFVVASVEHRDGTGPSAVVVGDDGTEKPVDFLRWDNLEWPDLPSDRQPKDDTTLRHEQLKVRLVELKATIDVLKSLDKGEVGRHGRLKASRTYDWTPWSGKLDVLVGHIGLAGHSFGGTAALAAADDDRFDPCNLIIMDPAVQRLEPWAGTIRCPVLCVNSDEFTLSDDQARLLELAKTCQQDMHILALPGTTHPSFSDVFLITPSFGTSDLYQQSLATQTGLKVYAYEVFIKTIQAIDTFVAGGAFARRDDRQDTQTRIDSMKQLGRLVPATTLTRKPIGKPGEVLYQRLDL